MPMRRCNRLIDSHQPKPSASSPYSSAVPVAPRPGITSSGRVSEASGAVAKV